VKAPAWDLARDLTYIWKSVYWNASWTFFSCSNLFIAKRITSRLEIGKTILNLSSGTYIHIYIYIYIYIHIYIYIYIFAPICPSSRTCSFSYTWGHAHWFSVLNWFDYNHIYKLICMDKHMHTVIQSPFTLVLWFDYNGIVSIFINEPINRFSVCIRTAIYIWLLWFDYNRVVSIFVNEHPIDRSLYAFRWRCTIIWSYAFILKPAIQIIIWFQTRMKACVYAFLCVYAINRMVIYTHAPKRNQAVSIHMTICSHVVTCLHMIMTLYDHVFTWSCLYDHVFILSCPYMIMFLHDHVVIYSCLCIIMSLYDHVFTWPIVAT